MRRWRAPTTLSTLQQDVADYLPPDSEVTETELVGEIIEELETATEIEKVREALDEDPERLGEKPNRPGQAREHKPSSASYRH